MNVLREIVEKKRLEIERAKAARPLTELQKEAASFTIERRPFRELFNRENVLIAEIKPKSPTAGELITSDPLQTADLYAKSAADVISVLTDKEYFGGDIELLREVRRRVPQSILRKDFIVDEYQVYETLLSGADVFLLIAAILPRDELRSLQELGARLGLESIVEVHDDADLAEALGVDAEVIGINNRDLKTLETDLSVTEHLMKHVPQGEIVVSESGIFEVEDVKRVHEAGVRGILVGTSILQSKDPIAKIAQLKKASN